MRTSLRALVPVVLGLGLAACAPPPPPVGEVQQANYINGGFESLATNYDFVTPADPNWTLQIGRWGDGSGTIGFAKFPPTGTADLNYTINAAGSLDESKVVGAGTSSELTMADSLRTPFSGTRAARVNGPVGTQGAHNVNVLTQQMTVGIGDVDASDGLVHVRFAAAPVLNYLASHAPTVQPYFFITVDQTNVPGSPVNLFNTFNFTNQPGVQWKTSSASINAEPTLYTDWEAFDIAPGPSGIKVGDKITATIVASGCSQNGHFGEVYVDDFGTTFPYPNVKVSAPAFTTLNTTLTYTVTVKNNSTSSATGVIVDFTTPILTEYNTTATPKTTATTWNATSAPGVTCTNPTASTAGTVVCNVGTLASLASYTFTVTVNIPTVAINPPTAGGYVNPVVNEGTYDVKTDQHPTPIGGGLVQTYVTTKTVVGLDTKVDDGKVSALWGSVNAYTATITNHGPSDANGVVVTDTRPATLSSPSWACSVVAGSPAGTTCGATVSGTGAINATVNIPVGGTLSFAITNTTFTGGPAEATVTYVVTATPNAATQVQSTTFNNIGTDSDTISATLDALSVTIAGGNGTGAVVSQPVGINCPGTCSSSFADGSQVALTAEPGVGSVFTGWTGGGCPATVNPCVVTLAGATAVTARFDMPTLTSTLGTTSNGNSASVRPGDTAAFTLQVTIPAGAQSVPLKLTDVLPTGLAFVSAVAPVITGTGALTCSVATCTTPTTTTGTTSTWDFGAVSCSAAGPCTITITLNTRVANTTNRGDMLSNSLAATALPTATTPTLTVIEPNLTITRSATPNTGLNRGDSTTVTVTLANNSGGANSDAFDVVVTLPIPTNFTGGTYVAGTCPVATTATFTGGNAKFTFPTGNAGKIANGASCTFTYKLTVGAGQAGNTTVNVAVGPATSKSITGAVPPAKAYTTNAAILPLGIAAIANGGGCTAAGECVSVICDTDNKCGYKDGDGPCTPSATSAQCRSGFCSVNDLCEPAGQCYGDGDCNTLSQFCNTQTHACVPKLVNGTNIPTITGHTPPLVAMCDSLAVGTSVCSSGVCESSDNKCGYLDGDGPCTPSLTAPECRSGFCSQNDKCEPMGQCFVDEDCDTATQFCNTQTHACVPRLPNGDPVPSITGHDPVLDGSCSTPVGAAVCVSLVCDLTDNDCGYANGDGSCDDTTAPLVCRSGVCGNDGKCGLPDGTGPCDQSNASVICRAGTCTTSGNCGSGCVIDDDCDTQTQFCNTPLGMCTPKLPNSSPIPTVSGHAPTLDGTCTDVAAQVVCTSRVCDATDNECGYKDGDGPCDPSTAQVVCRTGVCTASGVCGSGCVVDTDCSSTQYCDTGVHTCAPKVSNGGPIPNVSGHTPEIAGACTVEAAASACASGVCDSDNLCGYKDGDGSCTTENAALVCRTGTCRSDGKCGASFAITGGGLSCEMSSRGTPGAWWLVVAMVALLVRRRRAA